MRILIVEGTSEAQAILARKIESIDRVDKDSLDLTVSLASEQTFIERLAETDVVLIGAGLAEQSSLLARKAKLASPTTEILVLVPAQAYARGAFRSALSRGVRKVFADNAPLLDIVQELIGIHSDFCESGRARSGRVVAVVQAKGGIGATSTCAALAEVCNAFGRRTLLWDLDIETRDLCRGLAAEGNQAAVVRGWIEGTHEISRDSLRNAMMHVSALNKVLPPPDEVGAAVDLVGRVDAIELVQSVLNLSRAVADDIIVDIGGRLGPAAGAILRHADVVVMMLDDSILGLSAARFFMPTLKSVVRNLESLHFLCSGVSVPKQKIMEHFGQDLQIGARAWRLPNIPFDHAASRWPGSGRTLYSLGSKKTRKAFEQIATELQLIENGTPVPGQVVEMPRTEESAGIAIESAAATGTIRALWRRVANSI